MARKLKLTPELGKKLCEFIAAGTPAVFACKLVGINEVTFYRWKRRAQDRGEEPFKTLFESVDVAEAQAVSRGVMLIQKAMAENWQAAAWFLERRHPEHFGKKIIDVNQKTTVDINVKVDGDVDALMQQYRSLKADELADAINVTPVEAIAGVEVDG